MKLDLLVKLLKVLVSLKEDGTWQPLHSLFAPVSQAWWLWSCRIWRKEALQSTPGSRRGSGWMSTGHRDTPHSSCPAALGTLTSFSQNFTDHLIGMTWLMCVHPFVSSVASWWCGTWPGPESRSGLCWGDLQRVRITPGSSSTWVQFTCRTAESCSSAPLWTERWVDLWSKHTDGHDYLNVGHLCFKAPGS